ncbi:MAG: hypothetical protein RIT03_1983 [Bacteroidota bacterium]|jgi:hypothetical protein
MKKIVFLFALLSQFAIAQTPLATVTVESTGVVCAPGQCTTLTANYYPGNATTSYTVSSIPYAPTFPFTGGTTINANADDTWSSVVNLPFSFSFFNTNYTQILVGSNGLVTFGTSTYSPNGFCNWNFTQTIPNAAFPVKNAIYGVYQDTNISAPPVTNPLIQNVNYYVLDSGVNAAPNRVFIANFNELPAYSCDATNGLQTSQIVLHETTNIIEILINKRTPCVNWVSGNGVVGIQNSAGTLAYVPPGRNTGSWSATNEAWRFTPAGASTAQLNWQINGVFVNAAPNPWNYCPQENEEVAAVVVYSNGTQTNYISGTLGYPLLAPLPAFADPFDITVCSSENPTQVVDLTPNNLHILNSLNAADYNIRYYLDPIEASNTTNNYIQTPSTFELNATQTIYAAIESYQTGCVYVKPFQVIVIPFLTSPTGPSTQNFTAGQTLADLTVNGTGIVWYTAPIGGTSLPDTTPLIDNNTYFAAQSSGGCESRNTLTNRLAVTTLLVLDAPAFTANAVKIKPNPVLDLLQIESSVQIEKVQVYSLDGREIQSETVPFNSTTLDLRNLNSGVYFITLSAKTGKVTQKIIKK